jgi:hypothetical protein
VVEQLVHSTAYVLDTVATSAIALATGDIMRINDMNELIIDAELDHSRLCCARIAG